MTDWSSLLQRHVAAASPRPFDDVLRRVRHRRRRQALAATLGMVLVVAGTALAVNRSVAGPVEQFPANATAPPTITVGGAHLRRDKAVPFTSVLTTQRADHSLVVFAGTRPGNGADSCHPWSMPYVLRQDGGVVTIGVYDYVPLVSTGCFAYGLGTARLSLDLGRALGDRQVVDATSGRQADVVDESRYLTTERAPAGYDVGVVSGGRSEGWTAAHLDVWWQGPNGAVLTLTEGPPVEVLSVHVQHVATTQVRGHDGQVVRTAGGNANRCLRWTETPDLGAELCSRAYTQYLLSVGQLVAFAETLRRRTPATLTAAPSPTLFLPSGPVYLAQPLAFGTAYLDLAHRSDIVVQWSRPDVPSGCRPWLDLHVVAESADVVRLGLYSYEVAHPACIDRMPFAENPKDFVRVHLAAPLGRRVLLDVGNGESPALVVDPSQWLTPGYLPPGFTDAGQLPFHAERGGGGAAVTTTSWAAEHGGVQLTLQQGQALRPGGGVVSHVIVRGHYGTYSNGPGQSYPIRCLSWLEAASDRVVLCSHGGELKRVLSDPELLRIAAALHLP
jgi:hypothetical protein